MDSNDQHRDDAAGENTETASQNTDQNDQNNQPDPDSTNAGSSQDTDNEDTSKSTDNQDSNEDTNKSDEVDHNKQALLADLHKERSKRQSLKAEVEKLTADVADYKEVKTELESYKSRYDRLEQFLLAAGGNVSKALDSRSFTKDLFESDKDIAELVESWNKSNPSAISGALSGSGQDENQPTLNDLLRAAR